MKFLVLLAVLWLVNPINAQIDNSLGNMPPGISWRQIDTDSVKVVYPIGLEAQAQRIVNMVHYLIENNSNSIGDLSKKIDIFLIDKTSVSNGYVTPFSFHSIFFTMPPQYPFAGTVDWMDLLTIHEYRHVMQMNNATQGLTKWVKYVFGDILWGGAMFSVIPNWFWEGDAVYQETALTYSGRGRTPLFHTRFDDIMALKNPYSYEKMRCGSYADIVPDYYVLGYKMVEYGREKYGNDIWKKCTKDAVSFKGIVWPFSKALKRYAGVSTKGLYKQMVKGYKTESLKIKNPIEYEYVSKTDKSNPTFYSNPKFKNNSELYVLKASYNSEASISLLSLNNGVKEKEIIPIGFGFGDYDIDGNTIVWSEINKHPRWDFISCSNIYKYDVNTERVTKLTSNNRYFSPAISPNKKMVAVMDVGENMKNNIVILDINSGNILNNLPNEHNYYFRKINWVNDTSLIAIIQGNSENAIAIINIESGEYDIVLPFMSTTLYDLSISENIILFSAKNGEDIPNVFYINIDDNRLYRYKYKHNNPLIMPELSDDGKMVFCEKVYNNTVLKIGSFIHNFDSISINYFVENERKNLSGRNIDFENRNRSILDEIPNKIYHTTEYNPSRHLLNFHSLIPYPLHPNYSLIFLSQDKLDKMRMTVTPSYNVNDKSFSLNTGVSYGGWYPIFYLGIGSRFNIHHQIFEDGVYKNQLSHLGQLKSSISIPWRYTSLNFSKSIIAKIDYSIDKYFWSSSKNVNKDIASHLDFNFSYSNVMKSSYRSFYPKIGFLAKLKLYDISMDNGLNSISGSSKIYLPGLFSNHSIRVRYGFWGNLKDNKSISSQIGQSDYYFARGYKDRKVEKMVSGIKINYAFPLVYPDFSIGSFVFFKRIRTNLYFDIDRFDNLDRNIDYKKSVGIEIIFDNVYFRSLQLPLGIGIDYLFDKADSEIPINYRMVIGF